MSERPNERGRWDEKLECGGKTTNGFELLYDRPSLVKC